MCLIFVVLPIMALILSVSASFSTTFWVCWEISSLVFSLSLKKHKNIQSRASQFYFTISCQTVPAEQQHFLPQRWVLNQQMSEWMSSKMNVAWPFLFANIFTGGCCQVSPSLWLLRASFRKNPQSQIKVEAQSLRNKLCKWFVWWYLTVDPGDRKEIRERRDHNWAFSENPNIL